MPKSNVIECRKGDSLSSAGDNDLIMKGLDGEWLIGYFPQLRLTHLIPKTRLTYKYFSELWYQQAKSDVKAFASHRIQVWRKISKIFVLPLKIISFFTTIAWLNQARHIKWRGKCGFYEATSELEQ